MKPFHLTLVTPQTVFFDGEVVAVTASGEAGSFGVLANHAPLISTLLSGSITLTTLEEEKQYYQIGSGFLDVLNNRVTLLTTSIEKKEAL